MCTSRINGASSINYVQKTSKKSTPTLPQVSSNTNPIPQSVKTNYLGSTYKNAKFDGVSGNLNISASLAAKNVSRVSTGNPDVDALINASPAERKKPEFYQKISNALTDPTKRALLIKHFDLNSPKNIEALKVAVFMEGGRGFNEKNMMVTGEVIMNRAIAMSLAKGRSVPISEVMKKPNQFEVNNATAMHSKKDSKGLPLKTFDEVMAQKRGEQYQNSMDKNVASVVNNLVSGQRGETGVIHYGFKGRNGINHTDTPKTDYYTTRSW
jgi:hypothetical protein